MDFISWADVSDNILTCRSSDIAEANAYLSRLAKGFGLSDNEILFPPQMTVRRLGCAVACYYCALSMVGSDTTVMVNGARGDDIYLQKVKLYKALIDDLSKGLNFSDFAKFGIDEHGKGGIGVISLHRR